MYTDLEGKTALVTGSGRRTGIGFAIAEKLAESGANIVISDLAGEEGDTTPGAISEMEAMAQDLADRFGTDALAVALDVTDPGSISRAMETAGSRFGQINILVNNAGAALGVPNEVKNYDESLWMKTIDINLHGVFRMSRAVLPFMAGQKGSIINLSSRAGKVPPLWNGAYAVSKAGVIMLTKVMALELAGEEIRANAICPGLIMTDMQEMRINLEAEVFGSTFDAQEKELATRVPMGYLGGPEDVASLAAFLASDASSYITGQAINVCGGQTMEL